MDGFSPYYQDLIFSRLSQHLHPKHGRLYIVGLNPIPDKVDGDGQIICEVTKLRDACILLAGKITVMLCRLVVWALLLECTPFVYVFLCVGI